MDNKKIFLFISIILVITISIFLLDYNKKQYQNPHTVYTVYVDGKKIGNVASKKTFESYINTQEEKIKKQYEVDQVYVPNGVEIKKEITYNENVDSDASIYNKLVSTKQFTIKGVTITIKAQEKDEKDIVINVLNKEIFDEALKKTITAFVSEEQYELFVNDEQEPIVDTGSIIEDVYLQEKVTYKNNYISTKEEIFTDASELAKYLLYGTTEKQKTYIVKEGDTIEEVAKANKLNANEFLIANPEFKSVNTLLYEGQEVLIGLINPVINVVVEVHSVEEEERNFEVEIKYDEELNQGNQYVEREGEDGLYQVTNKYQYINGQLADTTNVGSTEIKPPVNKILVKGDKYVPDVADLSYWAWPTDQPYTITSFYEYRWGSFHDAIDIYGTGYGSPIYSSNNGVVHKVGLGYSGGRGNYVVINHNAGGYYTMYMHLHSVTVSEGQTVSRGQKIGTMGNSGFVVPSPTPSSPYAGTHLHYGVYIGAPDAGGYTVNPLSLY